MNALINARKLADYILAKWGRPRGRREQSDPVSENIAALLVDAVFQAGLNYRTVVFPRVCAIARAFPGTRSLAEVEMAMSTTRFWEALSWNHPVKPERLRDLVAFLRLQGLSTVSDIRSWIASPENRLRLRTVNGVGEKTVDYLARLVGLSVVAVDRHGYRVLREAGILARTYAEAKRILEFAADLLQMGRARFDWFLWSKLSGAAP